MSLGVSESGWKGCMFHIGNQSATRKSLLCYSHGGPKYKRGSRPAGVQTDVDLGASYYHLGDAGKPGPLSLTDESSSSAHCWVVLELHISCFSFSCQHLSTEQEKRQRPQNGQEDRKTGYHNSAMRRTVAIVSQN